MIKRMLFIFNYLDTLMDRIHDFANWIVDRLVIDSRSFFDEYLENNLMKENSRYFLK